MEEEKISPTGYRSRSKDFDGLTEIKDPRREKRIAFMEIPLQNPIEKLSEHKLKKNRERKQKMFNENREQRLATNNTETISDNPSIKQLAQFVSKLAEALRVFETTTIKELKNIMKMIDLKEDQTSATINKIGNFQKKMKVS